MATLKLEIVTPEEKIYSEDVDMVTLPGSEGELGVYPNHVPVLTALKPGELRIVKDGRERARARSTRNHRRQRHLSAGTRSRGTNSGRAKDFRHCVRGRDRCDISRTG